MDQDRIEVLMAKSLAGELSPEENEELEWAMLANPALRVTLQVLQRMREMPMDAGEAAMMERGLQRWKEMERSDPGAERTDERLEALPAEPAPVRSMSPRWWMAAAAVMILAVAGVLLWRNGNERQLVSVHTATPVMDKEISTRYGTRVFQELPDGSRLWLNAGSKVKYADSFRNGRRELTLVGEAFFDVKHDPAHPFVIHTGGLDVRVLGTSFNIKAYPGDSTVETTLIKGKVELDPYGDTQHTIVMQPNEKIVLPVRAAGAGAAAEVQVERKKVAPDPTYKTVIETSWVEDKLVFRNETFADVTTRLERWYNIHFSFEDHGHQQDRLTGYFKEQPINNVMDALQLTLGFKYRIEGDTIRIY